MKTTTQPRKTSVRQIHQEAPVAPPSTSEAGATASPSRGIFLLDDHPIMLTGLRELIESEPGLVVCGTARDAESALTEIPRLKPDLLITDLTLPGKSGLELVKDLHVLMPTP